MECCRVSGIRAFTCGCLVLDNLNGVECLVFRPSKVGKIYIFKVLI